MHESSMNEMRVFINTYLDKNVKLRILDVGGYDVNGSYKVLFNNPNWTYVSGDIAAGPNVDVVFKGLYDWGLDAESFDVVISGQCLEHVKDSKEWVKQVDFVLKKGGVVCVIAPWCFGEHRFPVDCWRILPDGMRFLLGEVCGFDVLVAAIPNPVDCVGVARKKL